MGKGQRAGRRSPPSRGARRASGSDAPRKPLLSLDAVLKGGSIAAALGSILALFLTVGSGVSGLFGDDDSGAPRVEVGGVELEAMSLRTFLATHNQGEFGDYSDKELDRDVLVANIDARYENSSRGVAFPARLTLQSRQRDGNIRTVDPPLELEYTLDAGDDTCGCHEWFPLPARGRDYRVEVQIFRPSNAGHAAPLADERSDWRSF